MLIVAFACFLALVVAWLLVPASGRTDASLPASTGPFLGIEVAGD